VSGLSNEYYSIFTRSQSRVVPQGQGGAKGQNTEVILIPSVLETSALTVT
jgi:hypothetical protein